MNYRDHWILLNKPLGSSISKRVYLQVSVALLGEERVNEWISMVGLINARDVQLQHEMFLLLAYYHALHDKKTKKIVKVFLKRDLVSSIAQYITCDEFHIGLLEWRALASFCVKFKPVQQDCSEKIIDFSIKELKFLAASLDQNWEYKLPDEHRLLVQSVLCCIRSIVDSDYQSSNAQALELVKVMLKCIDRLQLSKYPIPDESRPQSRNYSEQEDEIFNELGPMHDSEMNAVAHLSSRWKDRQLWAEICRCSVIGIILIYFKKMPSLALSSPLPDVLALLGSDHWMFEILAQRWLHLGLNDSAIVTGIDKLEPIVSESNTMSSNIAVEANNGQVSRQSTSNSSNTARGPLKAKSKKQASDNGSNSASSRDAQSSVVINTHNPDRRVSTVLVTGGEKSKVPSQWTVIHEMSKSGGLRSLCWGLLNQKSILRRSSAQLLKKLIDLIDGGYLAAPDLPSTTKKEIQSIVNDVLVAMVEQGLLPILECIALGLPIQLMPGVSKLASENAELSAVPVALDCTPSEWKFWYSEEKASEGIDNALPYEHLPVPSVKPVIARFPEQSIRLVAEKALDVLSRRFSQSMKFQWDRLSASDGNPIEPVIDSSSAGKSTEKKKASNQRDVPAATSAKSTSKKLTDISGSQPLSILNRILLALVLSGNVKLRTNVFTGLILLASRHDDFARWLWLLPVPKEIPENRVFTGLSENYSSGNPQDGAIFRYLLTVLSRDIESLCTIVLTPVKFFLQHSLMGRENSTGIDTLRPNASKSSGLDSFSATLGPTVVVLTADQQLLRMQCPAMSTIAEHSNELAEILQFELKWQLSRCKELIPDGSAPTDRASLVRALALLPITEIRQLPGSYHVWQEVFSHMLDPFICQQSVKRLSHADLMEAFLIARLYRMRQLELTYSTVLTVQLSMQTFISVFEAGLGLCPSPSSTASISRQFRSLSIVGKSASAIQKASPEIVSKSVLFAENFRPFLHLASSCVSFVIANQNSFANESSAVPKFDLMRLLHRCLRFIVCPE